MSNRESLMFSWATLPYITAGYLKIGVIGPIELLVHELVVVFSQQTIQRTQPIDSMHINEINLIYL